MTSPDPTLRVPTPDIVDTAGFAQDPCAFLVRAGRQYLGDGTLFLLAHLDDGVLWGRVEGDVLALPSTGAPVPSLRAIAVQECRLFAPRGELYLWRVDENQRSARVIVEKDGQPYETLDERHILWGTPVHDCDLGDRFTLLEEQGSGLRHVVPLPVEVAMEGRRVLLKVRHYLAEDADGQVLPRLSRLVDLGVDTPDEV